jgi:ribosomal protein S18 acetylase RimI-like enzyme
MNQLFSTPKGDITIRMVVPEDAALLREMRVEALKMHPEAFAADVDMAAAEDAGGWAGRIAQYAEKVSAVICIAETNVQLIGMLGISRGHWPKTRHSGTLWGVYVKSEWRGYHIGEELVNSCIEWAKENGVSVVILGVNISNIPAIHCYHRCGFATCGVEPKVIYYADAYYDELLMVMLI